MLLTYGYKYLFIRYICRIFIQVKQISSCRKRVEQTQGSFTTELLKKVFDFIHNNQIISDYRRSYSNFTRNRTLTFPIVVCSILHLFKESVEFNISQVLPFFDKETVSGAAFSKARDKIKNVFS
jgi:hypothetical protein